jgi:1-acyl-sn-glycerol-3-phosphate acyltransferase
MFRRVYSMLATALSTVVLFPLTCLIMLVTLDGGASVWVCRRLWGPFLLWVGGAKLEVEGREHVDPKRPAIYVCNHQSSLDIPALFVALPVNFRFVAKSQLKWVPFLGWYLALAGHVFVDRGNRARAIASLEAAARQIRRGTSIVVYPEGTRSEDRRVQPFKKGPFVLALRAGVPICPVTVEGTGLVMAKNSWNIHPGPVRVKIGAPIDISAYREDEREALMREVRRRIIAQSVELGGLGGDPEDAIALAGTEGRGKRSA